MTDKIIATLIPEFQEKVYLLLENCQKKGYTFHASQGLRNPFKQAEYWAQSRSLEEKKEKIESLEKEGASFLAKLLRMANPPHGPHITNVIPGFSWHQWGEACDCLWDVDKKSTSTDSGASKDAKPDLEGYKVYADEAEKIGLTAGGHWTDFQDWDHVQYRSIDDPGNIYSAKEINDAMIKRFGHLFENI